MNKDLPVILHVITRLDPGGSAENTVLCTERIAPERYHSVVLTGPGLTKKGPAEEYATRLGDRLFIEPTLVRDIEPKNDIKVIFRLMSWFKRLNPSIIHLHSAKSGAVGRVAARLSGNKAKVIYTPHGHVFSGYGGSTASSVFTKVEKTLANWGDAIVGLTHDELLAFREVGAGHPSRFCVVPSGVDVEKYYRKQEDGARIRDEFGIAHDIPVLGFIGRFEEVKGPDIFIETIGKIHANYPNAHFLAVGDGEMKPGLEKRAEELGLTGSITFTGWRSDVPEMLQAMDLLLLTSRNEGMGRVLVEALCTEVPVVAMISGGVWEVVQNGITGIHIKPGDIDTMVDETVTLLEDPDKRKAMGKAGCEDMKDRFSIDTMIERLEVLYDGLLWGGKPATLLPQDERFSKRPEW